MIELKFTNKCEICKEHDTIMVVDGVWYCVLCADTTMERLIATIRYIASGSCFGANHVSLAKQTLKEIAPPYE